MNTADRPEYPTQEGRTAVITGANSGLGLQLACDLARFGARVVLACRNRSRAQAAVENIRGKTAEADLVIADLDLADLTTVDRFADWAHAELGRIHLLINNAGVYGVPRRRSTAQGFEVQFGVNHLGHFALTGRLLDLLLAAPAARVVTVSSLVHRPARLDFDDLTSEQTYRRHRAYARSKLANILFALELERRLRTLDTGAQSVAAHPGMTATNLVANGPATATGNAATRLLDWINVKANPHIHEKVEKGVRPLLHAALTDDYVGGAYIGPRFTIRGEPVRTNPSRAALDEGAAARLWAESEALTGVVYV